MERNIEKIDVIQPSLLTITAAIKSVTGVDIRVNSRNPEIISLKKIYYKIANQFVKESLQKYARFVKTKSHATVLHHLKTVDGLLETEAKYQKIYDEVIAMIANHAGTKEFLSRNKKVIHKVETIIKVEKEFVYIDKMIDIYDTKIPNYIIDQLRVFSEEQLETLYQTRIIPFSKMINNKSETKKLVKEYIF